VVLEDRKTYEA